MHLILILLCAAFAAPTSGDHLTECPGHCNCSMTHDELLRADCDDFSDLEKHLRNSKNNSIAILNLSHNKITKINGQLDKLTDLKTLDLSFNDITHVTKLLRYSKKLTHLNLSNNKMRDFHASTISRSVSSLYLANNYLEDVPADLSFLENIEHLVLLGNPLNCSCTNLELRDSLRRRNVVLSDVICASPENLNGRSWLQIKTSEFCSKQDLNMLDMMMGDAPVDAETISPLATDGKLLPLKEDLDEGEVWEGSKATEDDDERVFLTVSYPKTETTSIIPESETEAIEGSGHQDEDETFLDDKISEQIISKASMIELPELEEDEVLPAHSEITIAPHEGSGDVRMMFSNIGLTDVSKSEFATDSSDPSVVDADDYYDGSGAGEDNSSTTTTQSFFTGMINPFFLPGIFNDTVTTEDDFEIPERPNIFLGKPEWDSKPEPEDTTEDTDQSEVLEDTIVKKTHSDSKAGFINTETDIEAPMKDQSALKEDLKVEDEKQPKKTSIGTYVCLTILAILLVGLIGFAVIKGQVRKRRDRRLMRQQRKDVEHAGKEMVDMNKSLLGKPAASATEADKKINGKYELVPTHEATVGKNTNGNIENRPIVENVHKEKSVPQVGKFPTVEPGGSSKQPSNVDTTVPDVNGKLNHRGSISSDDVFSPHDVHPGKPNGVSNPSSPLAANYENPMNTDILSPGRDYVPVYSPDMGRVRIKMTETPQPTTPVLVTRTRSNAGDIIITPTLDQRPVTKTTS